MVHGYAHSYKVCATTSMSPNVTWPLVSRHHTDSLVIMYVLWCSGASSIGEAALNSCSPAIIIVSETNQWPHLHCSIPYPISSALVPTGSLGFILNIEVKDSIRTQVTHYPHKALYLSFRVKEHPYLVKMTPHHTCVTHSLPPLVSFGH